MKTNVIKRRHFPSGGCIYRSLKCGVCVWHDVLSRQFGVIAELHRQTIFSQITFSLLPLPFVALFSQAADLEEQSGGIGNDKAVRPPIVCERLLSMEEQGQ